ncbi:ABC transporter ATP-binding protein [Microbacterium sp.]|uniref:ABC transporter ATP-binding protein n=1 Tax=Microbacterium sp. TaxID=51671 RepID=UPI00333F66DB
MSAARGPGSDDRALTVTDLTVEFETEDLVANAVQDVSFHVDRGETLAIVGESGSGKSVTARALMGLVGAPGRVTSGSIRLGDEELVGRPAREMRAIRGSRIAMVFQDSLSALNPVFTIGQQLGETLRVHRGLSRRAARAKAIELLERVRIPDPERRVDQYPHEFSGGMRQRAMIAMSIALEPEVLVADEPTTALDVTVQAQIMALLADLQRERRMALVLITHDLGVVAQRADRVAVMYAGRIVEQGTTRELFRAPAHGYTRALLEAIPRPDASSGRMVAIPGTAPGLSGRTTGCAFAPRCAFAVDACREGLVTTTVTEGHVTACREWERVVA